MVENFHLKSEHSIVRTFSRRWWGEVATLTENQYFNFLERTPTEASHRSPNIYSASNIQRNIWRANRKHATSRRHSDDAINTIEFSASYLQCYVHHRENQACRKIRRGVSQLGRYNDSCNSQQVTSFLSIPFPTFSSKLELKSKKQSRNQLLFP